MNGRAGILRRGLAVVVAAVVIVLAGAAPAAASDFGGAGTQEGTVRAGGAAARTAAAQQALRGMQAFKRAHPDFRPSTSADAGQILAAITAARRGEVRQAAAAATFNCGTTPTWFYIRAGDDLYLKPDASGLVNANGNRSVDPWNQQFLPCWYSDWPIEDYAFLSNRTGRWLQPDPFSGRINANGTLTSSADHLVVFRVIPYDANFTRLIAGGLCQWPDGNCPYTSTKKNQTPGPPVYADTWILTGWELFRLAT